ncbi:MAG: hypothetical protein IM561_09020 [Microcystis sp. M60BS1]|uniref:hypothetical protein n=1 Tax=unclassified Microcystis TaxID=2643300 RepID=UPI002580A5BC|nr:MULTISPECIES: hypothetical protein [unclassified Microcystis]MCA2594367.1 hypothetical protein [Microcystis sp. M38BS1]MCA6581509.1 hypothetical protein [Pseudanabaena sp. M34BS1SP1A06MG]MCA2510510.1 hypothetical protein [Microcystis sp. M60BS1]MCA2555744.1 hypothetical protein [Microcystis sp. M43BS1]MCA2603427.1 hypothetical protein [Microcystis sp. M26BS1]
MPQDPISNKVIIRKTDTTLEGKQTLTPTNQGGDAKAYTSLKPSKLRRTILVVKKGV